jgi:hypothetical protein
MQYPAKLDQRASRLRHERRAIMRNKTLRIFRKSLRRLISRESDGSLCMCRIQRSRRPVVRRDTFRAISNTETIHRTVEDSESGLCCCTRSVYALLSHPHVNYIVWLTLIIRHQMPSLVYPGEAQIAIFPHFAVLLLIIHERLVARSSELSLALVLERKTESFPSLPITDIIGIAEQERNARTVVQYLLQMTE